jgi:polysaccharide export outer membrane protein
VSENLRHPWVQITRGSHVYRRPLRQVLTTPAMDAALRGGDRILIEPDPRNFKALGASQREEVIGFDAERVSALRALSLMGGMADTRADPRGILVLRRYAASGQGAPSARVVFSFDLTNADGMFSADEFLLQDGDIVMATQAPATTTARVLSLLGAAIGVGRAAQSL